jgi:Flp pilus assembly protein TadD
MPRLGTSFRKEATLYSPVPRPRRLNNLKGLPRYDKSVRLLVLASLLILAAWAEDPPVERGYAHFYNLDFDEAIADFQGAIALHPNDPELHNHLAPAMCARILWREP